MPKFVIYLGLILGGLILVLGIVMIISPPEHLKSGALPPFVLGILCVFYASFRIWKSLQFLKKHNDNSHNE